MLITLRLLLSAMVALALALAAAVAAAADDGAGVVTPHTWPASYKVGNALRGHPGVRLQGPESFTVYSRAMRTRYAEVYNARQAPIPLPPDLVQRFRGKVIGACACAASKCVLERPPPPIV